MSSLRRRLLVGLAVALAATLLAAGLALQALTREYLVASFDEGLRARAELLSALAELEGSHLDFELEDLDLRDLARGGPRALQMWRGERTIYRSPSLAAGEALPRAPGDPGAGPHVVARGWIERPTHTARYVSLAFQPRREHGPNRADDPWLVLTLSADAGDVLATLDRLAALRLGVGAGTCGLCALLVWVLVARALRPLGRLADDVARLDDPCAGIRLDLRGVPAEAAPLASRINELLDRLQERFAREREFTAEVAHELRTPLAGLRTTLEVARRGRPGADLDASLESTLELQRLVERLLTLARLESGRAASRPEPLDLGDAALETWSGCVARAAARDLDVRWELEPGLQVEADPDWLALALRNLFENATEYADAGGWIRIEAAQTEAGVRVVVSNSGATLTQAEADQARERFWRADPARGSGHCGLGLSLVDKATTALGGELRLRSSPGAEFRAELRLPGGAQPVLAPAGA